MCNEGNYFYQLNHHPESNKLHLEIIIPKHLPSDLISIDLKPYVISIVIKSKILRLKLWEKVNVEDSIAQRSIVTGYLVVRMVIEREKVKKFEGESNTREKIGNMKQYNEEENTKKQETMNNVSDPDFNRVYKKGLVLSLQR